MRSTHHICGHKLPFESRRCYGGRNDHQVPSNALPVGATQTVLRSRILTEHRFESHDRELHRRNCLYATRSGLTDFAVHSRNWPDIGRIRHGVPDTRTPHGCREIEFRLAANGRIGHCTPMPLLPATLSSYLLSQLLLGRPSRLRALLSLISHVLRVPLVSVTPRLRPITQLVQCVHDIANQASSRSNYFRRHQEGRRHDQKGTARRRELDANNSYGRSVIALTKCGNCPVQRKGCLSTCRSLAPLSTDRLICGRSQDDCRRGELVYRTKERFEVACGPNPVERNRQRDLGVHATAEYPLGNQCPGSTC